MLGKPVFYMSAYFEQHRELYYDKLQAISAKRDWDGWITFFLTAVKLQAEANISRINKIRELYEQLEKDLAAITRSPHAHPALEALFTQPVFHRSQFQELAKLPNRVTTYRLLNSLQRAGVLKLEKASQGAREALWSFPELLRLLQSKDKG